MRTFSIVPKLLGLAVAVVLAHLALLPALPLAVRGGAALLLLLLPGALAALALFADEPGLPTRSFLALCGGVVVAVPLLLALHALPGPLPGWWVVAACDALLLGVALPWLRQPGATRRPRFSVAALLALLIGGYGATVRLAYLGGAEFQGDEARALLMASGVWSGQDSILLLHKKGPLEVLLPSGVLSLAGTINEGTARLPFAFAAIGVLVGVFVLARDLFATRGPRVASAVGVIAVALAAVDGYLVAFARVVQYQSVVVLLQTGAVWCMWQFFRGAERPRRYLIAAALGLAVALLAHYDAITVVPALLWLALAGGRRRGWSWRVWLRMLGPALAGAAALLASFYVPFVLNDHFQQTVRYLSMRSGYDGAGMQLHNNLPRYFLNVTIYNTTLAVVALGGTILLGVLVGLRQFVRPRWLGVACALLLLLGTALLGTPQSFALPGIGNGAALAFGVPLAALIVAPATPDAMRVLLLWFAAGFVSMAFVLGQPNTHFYVMDVAALLLASFMWVAAWEWLRTRREHWLRWPLAVGGTTVLLLAVPYVYLMFVRQNAENWRDFPGDLPAVYTIGHAAEPPGGSAFGFPRAVGWKTIGALYAQHVLHGCYFSNEEELVTGWYTRGAYRCEHAPDYYFLADHPLDPIPVNEKKIRKTYHPFGQVLVDGSMRIEIYSREQPERPTQAYEARSSGEAFDRWQHYNIPLWDALAVSLPQYPVANTWQNGTRLLGYDMEQRQLAIGQTTFLSLYWNIAAPLAQRYRVRVDVRDAHGRSVGDLPEFCQTQTGDWAQFDPSELGFALTANARMPPGTYTLHVALQDRAGGAPLPLRSNAPDALLDTFTVLPVEATTPGWTLLSQPLDADFGDALHLRTAARDAQAPTGWLRYRLFWTTRAAPPPGTMLFAHLLNGHGERVAQVDLPLASEPWQAQQLHTSLLPLPLPPGLPSGDYRLLFGLYDPATGQRTPLHAAAADPEGLLVDTVHVP